MTLCPCDQVKEEPPPPTRGSSAWSKVRGALTAKILFESLLCVRSSQVKAEASALPTKNDAPPESTDIYSKCVLVTGGVGFVGSHIAEALLTEGREVVVYDIFNSGHLPHLTLTLTTDPNPDPNLSLTLARDHQECREAGERSPFAAHRG